MRSRLGLVTGWSAATGSQLCRKVPIQKRRRNFQSYLMDSPPPASSTSTTIFSRSDKGGWVCSARLPELIGRTARKWHGRFGAVVARPRYHHRAKLGYVLKTRRDASFNQSQSSRPQRSALVLPSPYPTTKRYKPEEIVVRSMFWSRRARIWWMQSARSG